ncbi:redox-sensitive transcriptional activator SoxR [Amycolatopsis umgeniensis]|uniref:MerR family redox-sensitive transcriptional activator SoxR n=1 Tax=Amycolatopsis umgeniensis TaxID=336628 RepID=A0A841BG08_9PSEU|nr:redox-sensitive transcriptional activator SoxR [Amycolatopsis umgeniensis]MBB5857502.1 MerR family redox-sensitive transcriptional activator SoxR [Amycolatopsis umgeniensis]
MPQVHTSLKELTVGQVAERCGTTVATLHHYERQGLITSRRTAGNQRRFDRDILRRVTFIRAAQRVGISLTMIRDALDNLPDGRTPTPKDWARLSTSWRKELDMRIGMLQGLRDRLDDCIGCGCLSLRQCKLSNPDDVLGRDGSGARRFGGQSG